jgi:hypothetical protein
MIDEILVRYYLPEMADLAERTAALVRQKTMFEVKVVDHSELTLDDFRLEGRDAVSIDRHLAFKFNVPYMRLSRMFSETGEIVSRKIIIPEILPENICIIDTDMVSSSTARMAGRILQTGRYSVPLTLTENQDLIDVEDLVFEQSLLMNGGTCSYLYNAKFFARRTSLPESLYEDFVSLYENARDVFV